METKTITVCKAIHIGVDCVENDPQDIKCGGPEYLGYDFYISMEDNMSYIESQIKNWLKEYGKPFVSISHEVIEDFNVSELWSSSNIEKCIKEQSY